MNNETHVREPLGTTQQEIRKGTSTLMIIHGSPLTERKSTFQAHLARVSTPDQVPEMVARLLENNKVDRRLDRNSRNNCQASEPYLF